MGKAKTILSLYLDGMEDKVIIDWRSCATIGTLHSALSGEASIGPQTRSHQAQLLLMLPIVKDNAKTLTVAFTGFTMVNAICMAQKRLSIRMITPKQWLYHWPKVL